MRPSAWRPQLGATDLPLLTYNEGNSSRERESEEETRCPKLEAKHKIFLSHSGAQKSFVEQLCVDLERETHYPFFDKRPGSLPKGKKFASLIIDAAKQCHVAVVVLSEEYLTSKWPMLELAEFVKTKKSDNPNLNLLPLFYKLLVKDLDNQSNQNRWKDAWTNIGLQDCHGVDEALYSEAVRELRGWNGLSFDQFGDSEVSYRKAILEHIGLLSPPDCLYDTRSMAGEIRLCEMVSKMFVEDITDESGSRVAHKLGLYGVAGAGKTRICQALCNHYHAQFQGRVCHVELGVSHPLDAQKLVLRKLLGLNKKVVETMTDPSQGRKYLKDHMKRQPVFLVIDNVTDDGESREEAGAYLEAGFHPQSRIMVTSRSQDISEALLMDPKFCRPMPGLTEEEAGTIYLREAAPRRSLSTLTDEERRVVGLCIDECLFESTWSRPYRWRRRQYNPMALRALGSYFFEISNNLLLTWEEHLGDVDKLKLSRDSSKMFCILGLQFSTFDQSKKRLFLDIALYDREYYDGFLDTFERCVIWLAGLHEERAIAVECKLRHLKRSGMINWKLNFRSGIEKGLTTHNLYREFAEWYVTEGEGSKDGWCVYQRPTTNTLPYKLRSTPSPYGWPNLMRIWVVGLSGGIPREMVQGCRNVVLLQLHHCVDLKVLNLHGLHCLRHLELVHLTKLVSLTFDEPTDISRQEPTYGTLVSLQVLILEGLVSLNYRSLPDFSSCISLQTLKLDWCRCCIRRGYRRLINYWELGDVLNLKGLGHCTQLQSLTLGRLPVKSLPGLAKLTNLCFLRLVHCDLLEEIPELSPLTYLGVRYYFALKKGKKFGPTIPYRDLTLGFPLVELTVEEHAKWWEHYDESWNYYVMTYHKRLLRDELSRDEFSPDLIGLNKRARGM